MVYSKVAVEILKLLYKYFIRKKQNLVLIDAPMLFETRILKLICFPIGVVYVKDETLLL